MVAAVRFIIPINTDANLSARKCDSTEPVINQYSIRVYGQLLSAEGHFITPALLPGCRQSHRGSRWECLLQTGVCPFLITGKLPERLTAPLGGFEYGTTVVW